jgi:hypothetical protein
MISRWIPIAFALIGFLIGSLAGLSLTPVVGALLPLLFAVIGGGSGFFATYKPAFSRSIGISVSCLAFFCLLGAITGIHLREGLPWRCVISVCPAENISGEMVVPNSITDQQKFLELISIKTVLAAMDLPNNEKLRIFQIAVDDAKLDDKSTQGEEFGNSSLYKLDENLQTIAEEQVKLKDPKMLQEQNSRPAMKH